MSKVVSIRLKDEQVERLQRAAHRSGRKVSEIAALMIEDALRERDFPDIEIRETSAGREAFIRGTRLKVWHLDGHRTGADDDAARIAELLEFPEDRIRSALAYADAYPDEIQEALEDNDRRANELKRILPNVEVLEVKLDATGP